MPISKRTVGRQLLITSTFWSTTTGLCSELDLAVPASGTVIAEFANDSLQLHFFCRLLNSQGTQQVTNWFFLSAEAKAEGRRPGSIISDPRFNTLGDDIQIEFQGMQILLSSNANLTVNRLTVDLHNSTLSCGTSEDNFIAMFTIFAYGKTHLLSFPI